MDSRMMIEESSKSENRIGVVAQNTSSEAEPSSNGPSSSENNTSESSSSEPPIEPEPQSSDPNTTNTTSPLHSPFPANWSNDQIASAVKASFEGAEKVFEMAGKAASFVIQWHPVIIKQMRIQNQLKTEAALANTTESDESGGQKSNPTDQENKNGTDGGMVEQVQLMLHNFLKTSNSGDSSGSSGSSGSNFLQINVQKSKHSILSSKSGKDLNVGSDSEKNKQYMNSQDVNKMDSSAPTKESWRSTLLVFGIVGVLISCFCAQWTAAVSKKSRLKLNKYYQRKKYEKDQLVQYISQAQIYRNNSGERLSLPDRLSSDLNEGRFSMDEYSARRRRRSSFDNGDANTNLLSASNRRSDSVEGGDKEHFISKKQKKRESLLNLNPREHHNPQQPQFSTDQNEDNILQVLFDDEEKAMLRFDDDGMLAPKPVFKTSSRLHEIKEELSQTPNSQNTQF